MKFFPRSYQWIPLVLFLCLLWLGCANIVPPEGGPKDTTPPVLLSVEPADSSLNTHIKKIEFRFDKFMEIKEPEKHFQISPFLRVSPAILSYGKRVVVTIGDSLLEDATTYRIQFGDALVDNRENTPYSGYEYIFSTGGFFDSLTLSGQVKDAESGMLDTGFVVLLYPEQLSDSAVFREKPLYATPVGANGFFEFTHLPARKFKIFAIQDTDNNYTYLPGTEKIDFYPEPVSPGITPSDKLLFFPFREEFEGESEVIEEPGEEAGRRNFGSKSSKKAGRAAAQPYIVRVDTNRLNRGVFDITKPLIITLSDTLLVDTQKLYLSFDDGGIEVEAPFRFEMDTSEIRLFAEWQPDKKYTLRLIKGWASDTAGNEMLPGKYFFRTKSEKDYGNLQITMDSSLLGDQYVLRVERESDSVYQKALTADIIRLELLEPGTYTFKVILDENKNGQWDTGDFLNKRHAEKVIPAASQAIVKAGWDNRYDFKIRKELAPDLKDGRFRETETSPGENDKE